MAAGGFEWRRGRLQSHVNAEDNGCSGPSLSYDEQDAVVDCN